MKHRKNHGNGDAGTDSASDDNDQRSGKRRKLRRLRHKKRHRNGGASTNAASEIGADNSVIQQRTPGKAIGDYLRRNWDNFSDAQKTRLRRSYNLKQPKQ